MDTQEKSTESPRRDLVNSYGSALITIGEKTYKKIEVQDGAIGWLARTLAFIIFPIVWWIKFTWLSHLSFIDKQIQTVEWISTRIFPSSQRLFSKIETLANFADSLPDKSENIINALGGFLGRFPFFPAFDWGLEILEAILNTMLNIVPRFGSSCDDYSRANEGDEDISIVREAMKQKIREVENNSSEIGEKKDLNNVVELFDSAWHSKNDD